MIALMRRTPAEEDSSFWILKLTSSPVWVACGPPQISLEYGPIRVHAHALAVLALKQTDSALSLGLFNGGLLHGDGHIRLNPLVDQRLNLRDLFLGHLAAELEVETQALAVMLEPLLRDVVAQHAAKRGVQQVRGGVQARRLHAVVGQAALEALLRTGLRQLLVRGEVIGKALFIHREAALCRQLAGPSRWESRTCRTGGRRSGRQ